MNFYFKKPLSFQKPKHLKAIILIITSSILSLNLAVAEDLDSTPRNRKFRTSNSLSPKAQCRMMNKKNFKKPRKGLGLFSGRQKAMKPKRVAEGGSY